MSTAAQNTAIFVNGIHFCFVFSRLLHKRGQLEKGASYTKAKFCDIKGELDLIRVDKNSIEGVDFPSCK